MGSRAKGGRRPGQKDKADGGLPSGLAATVTLVVAGLAAVGVTGNFLPRMARDEPNWVRVVMIGALAGAAIIAIVRSTKGSLAVPATLMPHTQTW